MYAFVLHVNALFFIFDYLWDYYKGGDKNVVLSLYHLTQSAHIVQMFERNCGISAINISRRHNLEPYSSECLPQETESWETRLKKMVTSECNRWTQEIIGTNTGQTYL